MAVVNTSKASLHSITQISNMSYILKGLAKQRLGFIVSAPDVGKGYLCLSIAYELATDMKLLKLKGGEGHFKTLYWPIEDGVEEIAKRMLCHMQTMPEHIVNQISERIMLWSGKEPLCNIRNGIDIQGINAEKYSLIEACKDVDLLIIDTLREAAGNADEVDHDQLVKDILQEIAVKGDVAVLLVHHLTKAATRGIEKISNVSGSGYSRTQANSRMHLYIEKIDGKNGSADKISISHIKANYIPKSERFNFEPLKWTNESLLCLASYYADFTISKTSNNNELSLEAVEQIIASKSQISDSEPKEINIGSMPISESSILKKEERAKLDKLVTDEDTAALKAYYEKRRRDQK